MGWTYLENSKGEIIGIVGDEIWDLTAGFLDKANDLYMKHFGSPIKKEELEQAIDFVFNTSRERAETNAQYLKRINKETKNVLPGYSYEYYLYNK
jgi:hypothetical protein